MPINAFSSRPSLFLKTPLASAISLAALSLLLTGCGSSSGKGGGGGDTGLYVPDGEVRVGVADSGFRETHEVFDGKIMYKTNAVDGSEQIDSEMAHGTMVASVVAMQSDNVAMMFAKVNEVGSDALAFADIITYGVKELADNGAQVINASYSGLYNVPTYFNKDYFPVYAELFSHRGLQTRESLQSIVTSNEGRGSVYVVPAGNSSEAMSSSSGNPMYWSLPEVNARMLIVGSTIDGDLASFSSYPGEDVEYQARFLTAPGDHAVAYHEGDKQYAYAQGTSFSAPVVSAYAAEILHHWPHLDAVETSKLLLDTADKGHAAYSDNDCGDSGALNCGYYYFGQGAADLNEALKPQGDLMIPTGDHLDDGSVLADTSYMRLSSAFGEKDRTVGRVAVFDDLGRDYAFDMQSGITSAKAYQEARLETMSALAERGQGHVSTERHLGKDYSFSQRYRANGDLLASRFDTQAHGMTLSGFYFSGGERNPMDIRQESEFMPMLAWQGGDVMTASLGDVRGFSVNQPLFASDLSLNLTHWHGTSDADSTHYAAQRNEVSLDWSLAKGVDLEVGYSKTSENQGLMGATGGGEMAFGDDNQMAKYRTALSYQLTPTLSGFATYEMGRGSAQGDGMITSVSGVKTSELALGMQWTHHDHRLGLAFSQPAHVDSGLMTLAVPVGRDLDGNVIREQRHVALAPEGRQRDIELGYARTLGADAAWTINLMHTLDPGHDPDASSDTSAVLSVHTLF